MIEALTLLHYLSEDTYKKICGKFNLDPDDRKIGDHYALFDGLPITKIHLFNIQYQAFGHIWFMRVHLIFPRLKCSYDNFESTLYKTYEGFLGLDIMADFPKPNDINCDYIEYSAKLNVDHADTAIKKLHGKLAAEQLDCGLWDTYKKANSTITFLACKEDDAHLKILARCHGTAMKRIIKDDKQHRATGICLSAAVNPETENLVLNKQLDKYIRPVLDVELKTME